MISLDSDMPISFLLLPFSITKKIELEFLFDLVLITSSSLEFLKPFPGDKNEEGVVIQQQSGNYLIHHLCHHFDTERSYTSLTLVRDTYGLHTK